MLNVQTMNNVEHDPSFTLPDDDSDDNNNNESITRDNLPAWLSAPTPPTAHRTRSLVNAEYRQIFERVIGAIYKGQSLQSLLNSDMRDISYEAFFQWMLRNPERRERFREAQEMRTEMIAGEILQISDGVDSVDPASPDTVVRDKLRIDTRKWLMGAHNRKRYGETKQIEVAGSVSILDAITQANSRVLTVTDESNIIDVEDLNDSRNSDEDN